MASVRSMSWARSFGVAVLVGGACGLAGSPVQACTVTGNATTNQCDSNGIDVRSHTGTVTVDINAMFVSGELNLSTSGASAPLSQTLTITNSYIISTTYTAVSVYSAIEADMNVQLDSGTVLNANGGSGGLWLRNEVGGTIFVRNDGIVVSEGAAADGITATSNGGAVTMINTGNVASTSGRGLYADGGSGNPSPVAVSVTNSGIVQAGLAGIRVIGYHGTASLSNSNSVTSETRQALVTWAADGDASITNSGTVLAKSYVAVHGMADGGNVTITNSGSVEARNTSGGSLVGYHGIRAEAGYEDAGLYYGFGNVTVTNEAVGEVTAASGIALYAWSNQGTISITNDGMLSGALGIAADTRAGTIGIANTNSVVANGPAITTGDANTTITNSGTIKTLAGAGSAAISMGRGNNELKLLAGSSITGIVTNGTSGGVEQIGVNTLTLDGSTNSSFDVSQIGATPTQRGLAFNGNLYEGTGTTDSGQYRGFSQFTKTGTSTWTLTDSSGTARADQNWVIQAGTLVGSTKTLKGASITNNAALVFDQGAEGTYAGVISGSGTLTKTGAGKLILTGDNTYTGNTVIDQGTLQIGNGGTTGSVAGNIINNGALVFHRAGTYAFPGTITGSGSVSFEGGGTVVFTDAGAYSGPVTVKETTFVLTPGSTSSSSYTIGDGGTIGGTGTIGGLVVNSGGVAAPGNSPGTLNVVGPVTFNPGSTYVVEVWTDGSHDQIAATGAATINGGTVQVVAQAGYAVPLATYTILTAAGGVTGTFDAVTANFAFLTPTLNYGLNTVTLTLARNNVAFRDIGRTPNQIATATGVESLAPGSAVIKAVLGLTATQAQGAFDALSGEIHASAATVLQQQSSVLREGVGARLRQALANDNAGGPMASMLAPGLTATVWMQAYGAASDNDANGNAAATTNTVGGVLAGLDAPIGDAWRVGLVGGYSQSRVNAAARSSSATIDNYGLGIYLGGRFGAFAVTAGVAHGWHDLSVSRTIAFPGFNGNAGSQYGVSTLQAFAEASYRFDWRGTWVEPFAGLALVRLRGDGFTETGSAAALMGAGENLDTLYSSLGVRASLAVMLPDGSVLRPFASVAWQHAFGDVDPTQAMAFVGTSTAFHVGGTPIARNAALVGLGASYQVTERATLGLTYNGQIAPSAQSHGVKGSFSLAF